MLMEFVRPIDNCCFWCVGELSNFAFIVELLGESDFDKATEIAERELGYWCDPDTSNDESYYEGIGYVEAVENALEGARIPARYYVNMKERIDMVEENGMVMLSVNEYNTLRFKVETLEERVKALQQQTICLMSKTINKEFKGISPRDFAEIYDKICGEMGENEEATEMIYTDATLIWNGLITNLGDGAAFANYVPEMLIELADELEA